MSTGSQSIDRAAQLLTLVVRADGPVSYTDLVEQTGFARSTAWRLLQALERNGLLERDTDGLFQSGALFTHYAARFDYVEALSAAAQPMLESLADKTGETVNLAVARGDSVVQVSQIDSRYVLGATNWLDVDVPPHCSALGKVLYAYDAIALPDGPLERRTPSTIRDTKALAKDLAQVRERGFAVARDELEEGLVAVAAPVHGGDGHVQAALGVSGPSFRIDDAFTDLGDLLIGECGRLTRLLTRTTRKKT